jgi:hypothetical protein
MIYGVDLAYVHHAGFSEYARRAAAEVARFLAAGKLSRQARRRLPVIEFGSGGGTTARYLSGRGFDVLGFDQSHAMVTLARRTAPLARFAVGSLASTPLPRCRAIIALGEVVNYLGGCSASSTVPRAHSSRAACSCSTSWNRRDTVRSRPAPELEGTGRSSPAPGPTAPS